jgi:3-hydroxyacyl-CoA dehydrogenase
MTIGQLGAGGVAGGAVAIIAAIGLGLVLGDVSARAVLAWLAKRRAAAAARQFDQELLEDQAEIDRIDACYFQRVRARFYGLPDEPEISDEQKELAARARKAARLGGYRRRRGF